MILIIFFPQKVYILINKSQRIHILKSDLKKSCPGDDGTIPERMSRQTLYFSVCLVSTLLGFKGKLDTFLPKEHILH